MTGLLRKDWYYMKEYGRTYVPLLLILCLVPGGLGGAYALALALALLRGTIANDEIRWDRMAASLPLRAETVVGGKYLLCLPLVLLGMAVTAVSQQTQLAGTWGFNRLYRVQAERKLLAAASLGTLAAVLLIFSFRMSVLFYRKRQRGLYDR